MVSTLFTALALIATGQAHVPPAPPQATLIPQSRPAKADRKIDRR
ncbi:MAG: hypothetical protein ACXW2T_00320 [Allosphingosinicella sp.]